jgi:acyl-CoA dehydrogenase
MSASLEHDTMVEDTLADLFSQHAGPEARQSAEQEGWMPELWAVLSRTGLPWVGIPEAAGGVGGELADAAALLRMAGRHAVPLPLAESGGLLGGWLIAHAGLSMPDSPITVPVPRSADRLTVRANRVTGRLHRVPWGTRVSAVVALAHTDDGDAVVLLDPRQGTATAGASLAGEPRDVLSFDDVPLLPDQWASVPPGVRTELRLRGALSRILLMAGALEAIAELTVRYSAERQQFGRPIGRFQAVAQRLARLSCETEAAALAAAVATRRFAEVGMEATFEVAAAKTTVGRAATEVSADAHQVHGAIGMSQEYPLHHFTRRLWAWRQEWGSQNYWAQILGRRVAEAGASALWPRIATGIVTTAASPAAEFEPTS